MSETVIKFYERAIQSRKNQLESANRKYNEFAVTIASLVDEDMKRAFSFYRDQALIEIKQAGDLLTDAQAKYTEYRIREGLDV